MPLIVFSHIVNIFVVTVIPYLILTDAPSMAAAYGPDTPARRILACLYATIALSSIVALALIAGGRLQMLLALSACLFAIQIIYKLATWPVVGLGHPVVNANLMIVVLHSISLVLVVSTLLAARGDATSN